MKIKDYRCKCGCYDFFFNNKNNQVGIYCSYCGKWIKWADKDEQNLALNQKPNKLENPNSSITKNDVPESNVRNIEPTNDLAVDCISREQAINAVNMCSNSETILNLLQLPPVTPSEPRKGHWILTNVEGNRVWHCNCSECGKDPQDYVCGSENWWLIKSNLPKFCPSCGSDNGEVEE